MQARHATAREKSLIFCELPTTMLTAELSYTPHCTPTFSKWQPICSTKLFISFAVAKHTQDTCFPYTHKKKRQQKPWRHYSVGTVYKIVASWLASVWFLFIHVRSQPFLSGHRTSFQCLIAFYFSLPIGKETVAIQSLENVLKAILKADHLSSYVKAC